MYWVDTSPRARGTIVSGGQDGTVRIWVDVSENELEDGVNIVKQEPENGISGFDGADLDMDGVKPEIGGPGYGDDTPRDDMSVDDDRVVGTPDKMEED